MASLSPIRLSVRNPVLSNLLMITLTVLGVLAFLDLPREMMPKISFNWAFVITPYPNVPAEDIEQLITIPLEEELADLDGIDQMTSTSSEGQSMIWLKYEMVSDDKYSKYLADLKAEVDGVNLPDDVEDVYVDDFNTDDFVPVISVTLSGDYPERVMHDYAEELKDLLFDIRGISEISVIGTREREIWVEVPPEKLYAMGLTLDDVAGAIRYRNFNLAAGDLKVGREKMLVRTVGEFDSVDEIGSGVILRSSVDGHQVFLRDIAVIEDRWEEESSRSRLYGERSVTLSMSKKAMANSLDIIDQIKAVTAEFESKLPPGLKVTYTNDNSIYILDILNKLQTNAWLGFILVILILWLTLGLRHALITAIGIPITLAITMIFLKYTGATLNGNSLFGLVLVLGMLVDDAVVVMENCFRYIQEGMPPKEAVYKGASEVAAPVTASVLTTIAAFLPLMLLPGIIGRFMQIVPIVVSLALLASLFECFFILPSHIADWSGNVKKHKVRGEAAFNKIISIYQKILQRALKRRKLIFFLMPFVIVLAGGLIPLVGVEMYRDEEVPQFFVRIKMPQGTSLEATDQALTVIEHEAMKLPRSEVQAVTALPGFFMGDEDWEFSSNVGEIMIDLKVRRERNLSIDSLISIMRSSTTHIPGIELIEFAKVNTGPPLGKAVAARVQGKYYDDLEEVAELLKAELVTIDGVYDIADNYNPGKRQVRVHVDPERAALFGLSVTQVAASVAGAFDGITSSVLRDGDDEIDIRVKFPEDQFKDVTDVTTLRFRAPDGSWVPFDNVASLTVEPGVIDIRHFEEERVITVSANVDKNKISSVEVNQALVKKFKNIEERYPRVKLAFGGEFAEFQEAFSGIFQLFLIGLGLIYVILGTQFRSFIQPLIIMAAIPFAFIGAMLGLLVGGDPFSITTLYGFVALAGIVVNNSIVMVTFINDARAAGMDRHESIIQAGTLRLRPIFLTSLTTIFGLLPMAIGLGGKSEVWAPLANTIVWGLAVSTMLTLVAIPAVYELIVDDVGSFFRRKFGMRNGWVKED
ncbi:MAG: efflux RND transporter permease subunit [bacterium]